MTQEKEVEQQQQVEADAAKDEQAGFDAGFTGTEPAAPVAVEAPAPEKKDEPPVEDKPKEEEAAPPAPSPAPTAAPTVDFAAELRKVHGKIGDLKSQLTEALKTKEAEGKPAALTAVELKRMKADYPEMSSLLQEDIAEVLASLAPKAIDPKVIDDLVAARVKDAVKAARIDDGISAVTDVHPNWLADVWTDGKQGTTMTPECVAWLKSMPQAEADAFLSADRASLVIKKVAQFYDWKTKESTAKAEKENRLKAALTPTGAKPRAGQATLSDEEAMKKGFEEGFNS